MCAAVSWVSWLGLTKTQTKKAKIFVAFGCMRDQGNFRLVYDVSLKVSCQVLNFKVSWSCLDTTLETLTISVRIGLADCRSRMNESINQALSSNHTSYEYVRD